MAKRTALTAKRPVIITAIALILLGGVGTFLYVRQNTAKPDDTSATSDIRNGINYGPPTEEERRQAEDHKDELVEQMDREQNNPSGNKKSVTPVITSAQQDGNSIRVNAYIAGIFEDNGTCTAVFTKANQKVTKTSAGFANVSTTDCTPFNVSISDLPSTGSWQVVISYSSATASGSSQSKQFEVE